MNSAEDYLYLGVNQSSLFVYRIDPATGLPVFDFKFVDYSHLSTGVRAIIPGTNQDKFYVLSDQEDAIYLYQHDRELRTIQLVEKYNNNTDDIFGLKQPDKIIFSPDGLYAYVLSAYQHSVLVFEHDPQTDHLTYQKTYLSGIDNFPTGEPQDILLSTDGKQLYLFQLNNIVSVFDRDSATGLLEFRNQSYSGFVGGSKSDDILVASTAISPNNRYVFSLMAKNVTPIGIKVFERDNISGKLTYLLNKDFALPSHINVTSDVKMHFIRDRLYIGQYSGESKILQLSLAENGQLSLENEIDANNRSMTHVITLNTSGFLYTTEYKKDSKITIATYKQEQSSSSPKLRNINQAVEDNYKLSSIPRHVVSDVSGKAVYVLSNYQLNTFKRDIKNGQLQLNEVINFDYSTSVKDMVISPDDSFAYLVTENKAVPLIAFQISENTGQLIQLQTVMDVEIPVNNMIFSNSGQYAYLVSNGHLSVYSRDTFSGQLTFIEHYATGFKFSVSMNLTSDGKSLYIGSGQDNAITLFNIKNNGQLQFIESYQKDSIDDLEGIDTILSTPDGQFVYTKSSPSTQCTQPGSTTHHCFNNKQQKILVFKRDPDNGKLTVVKSYQADRRYNNMVFNSDASLVYGTRSSNELSVFARNSATGELTFVERKTIPTWSGSSGGISHLALTSDDAQIMMIIESIQALAVLNLNSQTPMPQYNKMSFSSTYKDNRLYIPLIQIDDQWFHASLTADDSNKQSFTIEQLTEDKFFSPYNSLADYYENNWAVYNKETGYLYIPQINKNSQSKNIQYTNIYMKYLHLKSQEPRLEIMSINSKNYEM